MNPKISPGKSLSQSESTQNYYEKNTKLFLAFGGGNNTQSIHRAVWADGVNDREEAFTYPNRLIVEEIQKLPASKSSQDLRILDLGCGVGGSLFYLARHLAKPFHAIGITISPLQVRLAREQTGKLGLQDQCEFLEADYLQLPLLDPVDVVFAIEAFVHSTDVNRFFEQAAEVLKTGGRLILCDDFLTPTGASDGLPARHQRWLQEFRMGWHAGGLIALQEAEQIAHRHHLRVTSDRDLTPFLELRRLRDRWIAVLVTLGRFFPIRWPYWRSLVGGHALQQCLLSGLIEYHFPVFEKC